MFKSLNIGSKLVLTVTTVMIIGMVILISIISSRVASNISKDAQDQVFLMSKRYGNYIEGILNELIYGVKTTNLILNNLIADNENLELYNVESVVKNAFDNSAYANYAFLYFKDTSFLNLQGNIPANYKSPSGAFGMLFMDTQVQNMGGLQSLPFSDDIVNFNIVKQVEREFNPSEPDRVFFGPPRQFNINGKSFVGVNMASAIMDKKGRLIGVAGFILNSAVVANVLTDPDRKLYPGESKFLVAQDGTILAHQDQANVLRKFQEVNPRPEGRPIVESITNNTDAIIDDYIDSRGKENYTSSVAVQTVNGYSKWSVVVSIPKK